MTISRRLFRLGLRGARRAEAELLEEMDAHIALCVDHLVARGVPLDEAHRRARERFGDLAAAKTILIRTAREREGKMRRRETFDIIRRDFHFALRQARRELGLTAIIVTILALGIGANIVMFDVVDRLLLSPPPHIVDASRVVRPWYERTTKGFGTGASFVSNWPMYQRLAAAKSFAGVGAYAFVSESPVVVAGQRAVAKVEPASASLFTVLGVRPALGRFYSAQEDLPPSGTQVAVVSHAYYEQHPKILNGTVNIHDVIYRVVGVAPEGFTGVELSPVDVWIPLTSWFYYDNSGGTTQYLTDDGSYNISTVARLKSDVPLARATAEASALFAASLDTTFTLRRPAPNVTLASVIPGRGPSPYSTATVAAWLLGVAMVVLLIACANVTTLLLTRTLRRRGEIAVRLSLGVSRRRLLAQFAAESVVLVVIATLAAMVVARITHGAIYSLMLPNVASDAALPPSHITALVGVIAAFALVLITLAPIFQTRSLDIASAIRGGSVNATAGRSRARSALAVLQVTLSVILLVGAGLFVRSLSNIRAVPLGLDTDRLILARVQFPSVAGTPGQAAALQPNAPNNPQQIFWRDALRRVRLLPEVQTAALTIGVPFRSAMAMKLKIPGRATPPHLHTGGPYANGVGTTFFATLGTRLLHGRFFTDADRAGAPRVVIINETYARAGWPNQNPIGACVTIASDSLPCATIVGVVQDIHRFGVVEEAAMQFYVPFEQWPVSYGVPAMIVRTRAASMVDAGVGDVRHTLQSMSNDISYPLIQSFASFIDPQLSAWLLGARMFTLFGALAFVVALIGLYGLLAHGVAQRRHELGVRSALGASADDLVALVVWQGAAIVGVGLVVGLVAASLLAGRVGGLLFGVEPRDVAVYAATGLLAGSLALVVSIVPARRAAEVDPMDALRADG